MILVAFHVPISHLLCVLAVEKLQGANDVEGKTGNSGQGMSTNSECYSLLTSHPAPNVTAQVAAESPSAPTPLEDIGTTSLEEPEEPPTEEPHRWYAVIVGREPGVFCSTS